VICFDFPESLTLRFRPPPGIFASDTARTLYLLWRGCHIVSQHFETACQSVAAKIDERKPTTAKELYECLRYRGPYDDFESDSRMDWCEAAIPYFRGEKSIGYVVDILDPTTPAM
jgi:hypothetical protein